MLSLLLLMFQPCTIKFKLDTQEIIYTVDMFCDTLHLPVETPYNPFIAPVNIDIMQSFMQRVGYQRVVDKVSTFYTKFLAQPWKTMFKVFNRFLTTRTSRHDKTKINILQLFHAMVNRTNVDYASLLWWDFINCVFQNKDVIQYPRFTKLIIADLKKFPSISLRLEEDYHSIKDDISLVIVYTTGNVTVRGMLILIAFLTDEIRATNDYKEYETVFVKVVVLMNQPQPVVSTQGTHMTTPRAYRTPTLTVASPQGKKRKKMLEKQASLLSLTLHKPTLAAEAQENVAKVQEKLAEEEIEKMVEGEEDEESYASEFANSMLNDDDDDSGTRIEPRSHKENPKVVEDDDDVNVTEKKNDEKHNKDVEKMDDVAKERDNYAMGSMETRNEQMQTLIPTPNRSPRKDLSFDKTISEELIVTVSPTTATSSKSKSKRGFTSNKTKIFPGSIAEVLDHCNNGVPELTFEKINEMIKEEMPRLVDLAVQKDREIASTNVLELISKEFATHGPKMIEELFRTYMQNTTLNLYPTTSLSTAEMSTVDLQYQLYLNMKSKPQD
ncbi:hypothetical protein Tco_1148414 [Tanacetum coccineum]